MMRFQQTGRPVEQGRGKPSALPTSRKALRARKVTNVQAIAAWSAP